MKRAFGLVAVTVVGVVALVSWPRSPVDSPPPAKRVSLAIYTATQRTEVGSIEISTPVTGRRLYRGSEVALDNARVAEARAIVIEDRSGIELFLTPDGARDLRRVTEDWLGEYFAIYLDSTLVAAPKIMSVHGDGRLRITGSVPPEEAADLARGITAP